MERRGGKKDGIQGEIFPLSTAAKFPCSRARSALIVAAVRRRRHGEHLRHSASRRQIPLIRDNVVRHDPLRLRRRDVKATLHDFCHYRHAGYCRNLLPVRIIQHPRIPPSASQHALGVALVWHGEVSIDLCTSQVQESINNTTVS